MSTKTKTPSKSTSQFEKEFREELQKMDPLDLPKVKAMLKAIMETYTKTPSRKKFVPVTHAECGAYIIQFREWLRAQGGKAADQAFSNIEWLQIAANNKVTEKGQRDVTRARNQLNAFFSDK